MFRMTSSKDTIRNLETSISEGTYPESDEFLKADLSVHMISLLLDSIANAKDALVIEIQEISKEKQPDVDEWILKAKQLQDDIAKCKLEAREIVEEHERSEAARTRLNDARNKVELLESEISFSQALQHELDSIEEIGQVLEEADKDLTQKRPVQCVERLTSTGVSIQRLPTNSSRKLLDQINTDLKQRSCEQLLEALDEMCTTQRNEHGGWIELPGEQPVQQNAVCKLSASHALDALAQLDLLPEGSALILGKLEHFLHPLLSKKTHLFPISVSATRERLTFEFAPSAPDGLTVLKIVQEVFLFLHAALPSSIKNHVAEQLSRKLVSSLIANWLNYAVPYELSELSLLKHLRAKVKELSSILASHSLRAHEDLDDWLDQIPRTWLNKRRMTSLDAVRRAFSQAKGDTRQAERVERQLVKKEDPEDPKTEVEDDWNVDWDNEPEERSELAPDEEEDDDDEASGWDFETESNHSESETKRKSTEEDDDPGEDWGWGDEPLTETKKANISKSGPASKNQHAPPEVEEIVLKELYTITDIPDFVLEIVGRDISDSQTLKSSQDEIMFDSPAPVSALQALPTLVLAMFRAIAPSHYNHIRNLSNMNLYNDVSYIAQKISETSDAQTKSSLQPALDVMAKFARQTYTRELDTQRTILSDLLDGAQGFVSCNSDQYRELCNNAVSSVVDRIRQLQAEYKNILGQSHLLQTTGSLISMVIGKVISDIEDLEDISEKESDRLVEYCQQISSLKDLFVATRPQDTVPTEDSTEDVEEPQSVSTIAVYVPNYFRFQYLTEILNSSLADIKYMWTEGGLKSDFSAEEVIDLIKALFAESNHRRNAITAIRGRA